MADIDNSRLVRRHRIREFILPDKTKVARAYNNGQVVDYVLENEIETEIVIVHFLQSVKFKILAIFKYELDVKKAFKCNFSLSVIYVNILDVKMRFAHKTRNSSILDFDESNEFIETQFQRLLADVENRQLNQSGWSLHAIEFLELRISRHLYLPGKCHIKLPGWILSKKALFNLKNNDDRCFQYAIVSLHLRNNGVNKIKMNQVKLNLDAFNFSINFPPLKKDILKFCSLNSASVNVFGLEQKNFYPILLSKKIRSRHFNLLYYENGNSAHYFPITSLSRLFGSQINKSEAKKYFCLKCLLNFPSKERLDVHSEFCGDNEQLAKIKLPNEKSFYKFDRHDSVQKNRIIITFDTESYLVPVHTCAPDTNSPFTNTLQRHELAAFGFYLYCEIDNDLTKNIPRGYHGMISKDKDELEDAIVKYLDKVTRSASRFFESDFPIDMSYQDEQNFQNATVCYICYKPFTKDNYSVRDHAHDIEKNNYRGACHNKCNLLVRRKKRIPVLTHCLGSYDGHYLVRMFASRNFKIKLIPHNIERYISFSIFLNGIEISFNDSYLIFHDKLDTVLSSLPHDQFFETKKIFPKESHELIMSKLPYPYSFLSGPESLDCTEYPDRKHFKNDLTDEDISIQNYEKGKKLWNILKCTNFGEFTFNYCKADCVQLSDGILYLRKILYESFGIELTSFYTLPQVAITCMLKLSKVEIQVFDESMQLAYDMVQRSLFGGLVSCNTRFTEATETRHIHFIDANGLYVHTSFENKLPISDYELVPIDSKDWSIASTSGEYGYMIECDIFFPDSVHDELDQLVPAFERKIPPGAKSPRLVSDFAPKKNYVLSLQHYQLLLRLGVRITKLWHVLRFKQAFYMREFIQIVTQWRKEAKNVFTSNLFKSIAVSVHGKIAEKIIDRKKIEIVTDPKRLDKLVRKGNFKDRHIYNYEKFSMTMVEMSQTIVKMNRPIIVSAMIWNLSKVFMFDYWYFKMKPVFGNSISLNCMDTDSYCFSHESDNYLIEFEKLKDTLDLSNLDPSNPLYDISNKKVLGKFKFENADKKIVAVCCVKSKVYSLLFEDSCMNKLKGVQKKFVKKNISFDDYKKCVLENEKKFAIYKSIISREHTLFTVQQCKLALECTDFKRHILPDRIHTLAHYNYRLRDKI
jgi:hypothetical protein